MNFARYKLPDGNEVVLRLDEVDDRLDRRESLRLRGVLDSIYHKESAAWFVHVGEPLGVVGIDDVRVVITETSFFRSLNEHSVLASATYQEFLTGLRDAEEDGPRSIILKVVASLEDFAWCFQDGSAHQAKIQKVVEELRHVARLV